ncbi:MAG: chitinase, partial [Oscillospiraceae bacterium]|nr:chitinase [Oscillospiraceae bacterium]
YDGALYKCLQAHTSQPDWTPTAAPSLWAKVLIPDPGTIPEWEQPDSTNPYMAGDKVTHNGKTWVSDIDNNVWAPGAYGWTEVAA